MPELPDITAYIEALERTVLGHELQRARVLKPFLVRSLSPSIKETEGRKVVEVSRLGKRIVVSLEGDLHLVFHLMIAGRFLWSTKAVKGGKAELAVFEFDHGSLVMTEAGTKRRASLHVVQDREPLKEHDRGGLDPLTADFQSFKEGLVKENRTLKRILTNPSVFSGIGNTYSDEILFAARLSPVRLSGALTNEEIERLRVAAIETLEHWTEVLRKEFKNKFPGRGQITAFRDDFYVHGRYGQPCRVCGMPIQRIVHAENETNYCARCQNEDRVLADRALSRLLKDDWPKTIEEMVEG
ncbi:MAG: formamidopyrimidine-DNA glycosylase [Armatimonadetes bacterium 55-13]|nr:MAG: formamidopyrimidine-DNA glycosylase [Armatimonadetes bacterium 55-13]